MRGANRGLLFGPRRLGPGPEEIVKPPDPWESLDLVPFPDVGAPVCARHVGTIIVEVPQHVNDPIRALLTHQAEATGLESIIGTTSGNWKTKKEKFHLSLFGPDDAMGPYEEWASEIIAINGGASDVQKKYAHQGR